MFFKLLFLNFGHIKGNKIHPIGTNKKLSNNIFEENSVLYIKKRLINKLILINKGNLKISGRRFLNPLIQTKGSINIIEEPSKIGFQ